MNDVFDMSGSRGEGGSSAQPSQPASHGTNQPANILHVSQPINHAPAACRRRRSADNSEAILALADCLPACLALVLAAAPPGRLEQARGQRPRRSKLLLLLLLAAAAALLVCMICVCK